MKRTIPAPEKTPRESVSKSRRFEILKRDGYKCQLCGRSQSDGVTLHVDHRIPLAKGGANEDENLWTLCEDCNLGKSDRDLGIVSPSTPHPEDNSGESCSNLGRDDRQRSRLSERRPRRCGWPTQDSPLPG